MFAAKQILNTAGSVILAGAISCWMGGALVAQQDDSSEAKRVESYLEELGLDELLVEHLEQQLERQFDRQIRKRYAVRLAELYTQQLLSPSTPYEQSLRWQLKAQQLIQVYPDLDAPVLRVAIFHARYQSVYHDFEVWWQSGHRPSQRQPLQESFRLLIRDLLQLTRRLEKKRRELSIDREIGSGTGTLTEIELARVDNVLLHAQYLVGWASYFRAVVQPENATEWLSMSERYFRGFLQIEPNKPLLEVKEGWFDFGNGWTSRGLIGLALCKQAEGLPHISRHYFKLAGAANDQRVDNLIDVWSMRGLVHTDQLNEAIQLIESKSTANEARTAPAYWVAVTKNGSAVSGQAAAIGSRMIRIGLAGLARQRQAGLIRELIAELNIKLESADFLSLWISGFLAFDEAEQNDDRNKREEAKIRLTQALDTANHQVSPADLARCEFLLATIRFRDHEFALAEPMFARVVNALKESDRSLAAHAMWRRVQALVELSRKDSRLSSQAFAMMDQLVRKFPESPHVDRIEFEKLKLNIQNIPDDEAIRRLAQIGPENEFRTAARYEMIQRQHRLWLDAVRGGRPDQRLLDLLVQWEEEYRRDENATSPRKLKLLLLVIDARIRETPMDEGVVKQLLDTAGVLAESNRAFQEQLYVEYQYYRFLYLQKANVDEAVIQANWIAENAMGTRYEQSALIFLARRWEQQVSEIEPDREQALTGINIYQRVSATAGNEPEQIKTSANARVAATRLAELHMVIANWVEADRRYAELLECFPNNQNFLAAAARCKTELGRFDLAKPIWRRLSVGVEAGTELWYESKYELAVCLTRTDPQNATKLVRQTMQLSPQMPQPWHTKFTALQSTLSEK